MSHIVARTLGGDLDKLLGKNLAEDVFGIDLLAKDDLSAVRVELGRLRRRLNQYYASEGKSDPVVISIPKGAYVAQFTRREVPDGEAHTLRAGISKVFHLGWVQVAATAALVVLVGGTVLRSGTESPALPRVVIAAFESQSPENEPLAFGLTADLVNRLAKFQNVVAVSREDAVTRDGQRTGPDLKAPASGADYRLSGYVLNGKAGPRLDIELISYPSGAVVWVDEFGPPDDEQDLYSAQLDIADKIARVLAGRRGKISRLELSATETGASRAAYRCVLRYHNYQAARSAGAHREIRHCMERAARTTPGYAEVWSSLAQIYLDELKSDFNRRPEEYDPLERAHAAALRGVEVAPESSTSYSVLAAVEYFRRDLDAFEAAGRKAIAINPNDADVISYFAHYLSLSGKWEEGQALQKRAMAMSPGHPPVWHSSSVLDALRRKDYQTALIEAELSFDPGYYLSVLYVVAANAHAGNRDATLSALAKLEELRPNFRAQVTQDLSKRFYPVEVIDELVKGLEISYNFRSEP
ncbi:tetratricopeptide repeat protein [Oceanibium sediminis]|uniref:tetratricopeptide repeat protein n=1 Tax=Oceanibium sediminis TaxID=2026339 RepID=UPI000DD2E923|nr:hypothetical protein [Oceanibium sediminis]